MFSLSRAGIFSSLMVDFTDMSFINSVFAKLKRHPKRIVFPDGDDPRVIRAAQMFYERDLGVPILLGHRDVIERVALAEKARLDHVAIINPETSSDLPVFCQRLERLAPRWWRRFGERASTPTGQQQKRSQVLTSLRLR